MNKTFILEGKYMQTIYGALKYALEYNLFQDEKINKEIKEVIDRLEFISKNKELN